LTRYLLRVTRDSKYGDSMERMMYNTILGAKPLQADGRAFYYSDYNFAGRKVYSEHRWPCCSGTMPQVAADYRINTYLRDATGIYVNLYIPSTVRWAQHGAQVSLTQKSEYPFDGQVQFELRTTKDARFAVNLRIPAWADGASYTINGKRGSTSPGKFMRIDRKWKNGDRVELDLPMRTRLEPIDSQHTDTVALLVGPLVLFGGQVPGLTRPHLLAAKKMAPGLWHVSPDANIVMKMVAWTLLDEQLYTTYFRVS